MRKILTLVTTDLKRLFFSPKAGLLLVLTLFFTYDFVRIVSPYADGLAVTPWVYPIFMDDWGNCLYVILLICVLMSDAPFPCGSELNIRMRVGKYVWLAAKILYIMAASAIYQVVIALLSWLVFLPDLGISSGWGYALRTYYTNTGGAYDASGNLSGTSLLAYAPVTACLLQLVLATGVSTMLGLLIFLFNSLFRNYTGTVLVSVFSCAHLLLNDFGFYEFISFEPMLVPTAWIQLGDLAGVIPPGQAAGILVVIILTVSLVCAVLMMAGKICIYD